MIIFLDFDGVTHSVSQQETKPFDDICIDHIHSCIKDYDIKIVITSSHREVHSQDHLIKELGPLGNHVVGTTPIINEPFLRYVRYHEAVLWLTAESALGEAWVAIDDVPGNFPKDVDVILTDPHLGFSDIDAERLFEWLKMHAK